MGTYEAFVGLGILVGFLVMVFLPLLVVIFKSTMHRRTAILLSLGTVVAGHLVSVIFSVIGVVVLPEGYGYPVYVLFIPPLWALILYFLVFKKKFSKDPAWFAYNRPVYVRWLSDGTWNCPHCRMTNMDNRPCERCGAIPVFLSAQDSGQKRMSARQKRVASKYTPQFSDCFQEEEEQTH